MDVNSVKERIRNLGPRHGLTMIGVAFLVSLIGLAISLVGGILSRVPIIGGLLAIAGQIGSIIIMMCSTALLIDYILSVCSGNEVGVVDCIKSLIANSTNYMYSTIYVFRAVWWRCIISSGIPTVLVTAFATQALLKGKIGLFFLLFTLMYVIVIVATFALCYKYMYVAIAKLYDSSMSYKQCKSLSESLTSAGLKTVLVNYIKACGINLLLMLVPIVNILIAFPRLAAVPVLFFLDGVNGVDNMESIANVENTTNRANRKATAAKKEKNQRKVEQPIEEPEASEPVDTMLDDMIRAIQGACVTKITYNGATRIALPIDVVIGKDGITKYNFFVKDGDAVKPIQIKASSIESLLVLNKKFDPAQYVDWEPRWNIQRDWNL